MLCHVFLKNQTYKTMATVLGQSASYVQEAPSFSKIEL